MKQYIAHTEQGFLELYWLFILGAVFFGITMVNGISPVSKTQTDLGNGQQMTIKKDSPVNSQQGLQLQTFQFISPTNAPPQSNDCDEGVHITSAEPHILWAIDPDPGGKVGAGGKIKIWYNDEHPISLGASSTIQTSCNGHLTGPIDVGDINTKDDNNFPLYPALFFTDITNNPTDRSGDAENNGTAHIPDEIWGSWKPSNVVDTCAQPNYLNLPAGADPFPDTSNIKYQQDSPLYRPPEKINGTEVIWSVNNLHLISGHTYRAQVVIHDGDQSFGGDIGEACTTISY